MRYALMTLCKRGDMQLRGNSWRNIYTALTWLCEDTEVACWEAAKVFDIHLCWVAPFDESRYTIPQDVLTYFADKGVIA